MRKVWGYLRRSLWFFPMIIVLLSAMTAVFLLEYDVQPEGVKLANRWPRVFGGGVDGSRQMLSVIASSVITVAGVAFSITIVVLSLASSQYSSRVLRNFMRDWQNQSVLGGFLGIYVYCLIVLRTIRSGEETDFVPSIAVLGSIVFALLGVLIFIYFIHHVASSIQASNIIRNVYLETIEAVNVVFSKKLEHSAQPSKVQSAEQPNRNWKPVPSCKTGYVRSVNLDKLCKIAEKLKTTIKMETSVGEFVIDGNPIAWIDNHFDARANSQINACYDVGGGRTLEQDVAFGLRQLVDVALKGLSPGINDTTSSIICVHYLGAILAQIADRKIEAESMTQDGKIRVIIAGATFSNLVSKSFDQIRQTGAENPAVLLSLLKAIQNIMYRTKDEDRKVVLEDQINLLREVYLIGVPQRDRKEIEIAFKEQESVAKN